MGPVPFTVIYWLGGILGYIDYLLSSGQRLRKMSANISGALGYGKKEARMAVLQNLQNHLRDVLELTKYPQVSGKTISSIVHFKGIDYLEMELKKGKGVILVTAHFGAKQLLQVGLGLNGYRVNQIHYHMSSQELSWIQKYISQRQRVRIEKQIPATFIPAKGFLRPIYECLERNQVLIIAGDGIGIREHMDKSYLPFNFLGKKMLFPTGMVGLAKQTGASIVPVFTVRENKRHGIVFEPPIDITGAEDMTPVVEYIRLLEKYIRRYPSLWEFWEEFEEGNLITVSER